MKNLPHRIHSPVRQIFFIYERRKNGFSVNVNLTKTMENRCYLAS